MNTQQPSPKNDASAVDTSDSNAPTRLAFEPRVTAKLQRSLSWFMWPLALVVIMHRTWALPQNPNSTDDFTTVWRAVERFVSGMPVYNEVYANADPHYLYSPGGTFLLSPIAFLGTYDMTRLSFAILQSMAFVVGMVILLRWMGVPRGSWILPAALVAAYHTEGVTNSLNFTNVNPSLFMLICAFMALLTAKSRKLPKHILAGVLIGIGMTVKPVLAPLLFIPFVRKNFAAVASALGVTVMANIIGSLLMTQPGDYMTITVPYLKIVRDFFNSSLPGQMVFFGAPTALTLLWQLFFGVFVLVALVLLLRWVTRDEIFWMSTTAGLLLGGAFFLSSLGQQYYSIMLLPMVLSVVRPLIGQRDAFGEPAPTVMLNWPAGLATAMALFFGSWIIPQAPLATSAFSIAAGGLGWALFLLTICGYLIHQTIIDVKSGRSFASGFEWAKIWLHWKPSANKGDKAWKKCEDSASLESPAQAADA